MTNAELQLRALTDARLAVHAASPLPAWLCSCDGARVLWANPAGQAQFPANDLGPADPQRRQIARLAGYLSSDGRTRLERLRGFGAAIGGLITAFCQKLDFEGGDSAVLIVAAEPAQRRMPLDERLSRLVAGIERPAAALLPDGTLAAANPAAEPLIASAGLESGLRQAPGSAALGEARTEALKDGRADAAIAIGRAALHRVGSGAEVALIAILMPEPALTPGTMPAAAASEEAATAAPEPAAAPAAAAAQPFHAMKPEKPPPASDPPAGTEPRQGRPVRFLWQMDADGRFALGSDEFTRLIGPQTATAFGRPWQELVAQFDLDPEGRVAKAIASRQTWSGITLTWPADDGHRLAVELSGLPVYDRQRNFAGYRGFGICRDLSQLGTLSDRRRQELFQHWPQPRPLAADVPHARGLPAERDDAQARAAAEAGAQSLSSPIEPDLPVDNSQNVVPLRPAGDAKAPVLTPGENSAFHELARQLSARLENDTHLLRPTALDQPDDAEADADLHAAEDKAAEPAAENGPHRHEDLIDLMPVGVLVYRLEQLLYVNRAFLTALGYTDADALAQAGGLDAILIEPPTAVADAIGGNSTAVTIATRDAPTAELHAQLSTVAWDGGTALALICTPAATRAAAHVAPPAAGLVTAEELAAILDTAADGIVMFDGDGRISACNHSAEALFGYQGTELLRQGFTELFAPESRQTVTDYLAAVRDAGAASVLDRGRDVLGRVRGDGLIPLSMIVGRTRPGSPNFFAVFRDRSQRLKTGTELQAARRQTERAATIKADVLTRISHEIRTPLNAIIGFADVMIDERLGPLGHERYAEYLKDIRASGEHITATIDEMLDLSRIESGKVQLAFAPNNLNDLLEQCVAVLQPRANQARIIIRSSLAPALPPVMADARSLRQIAMNLISNSIQLANAGGQVIVSTALSDDGHAVLRVRDTGSQLNDSQLAALVEPFGTPTPDQTPGHSGVSLALTKALALANRARFQIKSLPRAGTLIEVTFDPAAAMEKAL